MADDNSLYRKAALDRLASPERLDERLALPRYPRLVLSISLALLVGVAGFAAWLLTGA